MLAGPIHLQLQRGMVSALPMQDHLDEAAFDAYDDLVQCGAQDPLARCCRRSRVRPSELQIGTELHQVQRRSSSPATSRLAGSTASYCRRACAAEKCASCNARSSCLCAADVSRV